MTDQTSTGSAGDPTTHDAAGPTDPTDPKERFRQALDRKNKAAHPTAEGVRAGGAVHGPEVTGGGKRAFRRKTG